MDAETKQMLRVIARALVVLAEKANPEGSIQDIKLVLAVDVLDNMEKGMEKGK